MTQEPEFEQPHPRAEWVKPQVRQISAGSAEDSESGNTDNSVNPS